MLVQVRRSITSPTLGVMTFLNDVVQRFPDAISFAPGRPSDEFCRVDGAVQDIGRWVEYDGRRSGRSPAEVWASLGQYGDTAGIIRDLLAQHLATDLGIAVEEQDIVVTTGCQEAMLIAVLTLLDPTTDTLLVSDPSYIGITGAAELAGVPIQPVPTSEDGLRPDDVERVVLEVLRAGRRPRALYDVPDFNNPLGTCMPIAARHALLAVAKRHDLLILEDNPYGAFAYDQPPLPTLKALDRSGQVIYLGSFAKILFPGLRIGYMVADQQTTGGEALADAFVRVKSLTTVNTSPITQAIAGAGMLRHGGALMPVVNARLPHYRANRDRMLAALEREFPPHVSNDVVVSWNHPSGGFFLVVDLPFAFGADQLARCAKQYHVIVSPMAHFALSRGREHQVRLSFSYVVPDAIEEGIRRFASFVRDEAERQSQDALRPDSGVAAVAPLSLPADSLVELVERALLRRRVPQADAAFTALALVETSLRGVDTHGLRLLPVYLKELAGGRASPTPELRWAEDRGAVRTLDAGGALGIVAGRAAVDEASRIAGALGVGVVTVYNSNHFGAAAVYALALARRGLIGIVASNSDALVAAFGGRRASLGTNPLCMAVMSESGDEFCADFATSQIAFSRVMAYRSHGLQVPSDWVVDHSMDDHTAAVLKPLGGYKGQCLAMIVEILTSVLAGGPAGHDLDHFYAEPFSAPRQISHLFLALDPEAFGDETIIRRRITNFLSFVRGEAGVLCPGDLEAQTAAIRRRDGIPLVEPELSCVRELRDEEQVSEVAANGLLSDTPR